MGHGPMNLFIKKSAAPWTLWRSGIRSKRRRKLLPLYFPLLKIIGAASLGTPNRTSHSPSSNTPWPSNFLRGAGEMIKRPRGGGGRHQERERDDKFLLLAWHFSLDHLISLLRPPPPPAPDTTTCHLFPSSSSWSSAYHQNKCF